MPRPSFPGIKYVQMKVGWAKEHLDRLDREIDAWRTPEPYIVTREDDLENQLHIVRLELKPLRDEIGLVLGDFAYALRSGLDQLAWQLARLNRDNPTRDTCFPIHGDGDGRSDDRFREVTRDMSCEAIAVIKSLQPYHRGTAFKDHPLWQLNRLCNIDKHAIFAVGSTTFDVYIEPSGTWQRRDFEHGYELRFPLAIKDEVVFEPKTPELVFGQPIDNPGTPFEITEAGLREIYNFVERLVFPRFTRFFETTSDTRSPPPTS